MNPLRASRLFTLLALVSAPLSAQTLLTFDGGLGTVTESTGPPVGCGYPTGPVVGGFPTAVPSLPCPTPGLPGFGPIGSVAHDSVTDTIYVTDGAIVGIYTAAGVFLDSWIPLPIGGPITGITYDSLAGVLFYTDGIFCAGEIPPPTPGCLSPNIVAVPPFPIPIGLGAFLTPVNDLAWDPGTGSLMAVDAAGIVGNFFPGGGPGPFGFYPIGGAGCIPPGSFLTGIAVDSAAPPGSGTHYVTDGFAIAYVVPGGAPAPPTMYSPVPCYPNPSPPTSGLAFTDHAILFGAPSGPVFSAAGSAGCTFIGNPAFTLTVSGPPVTGFSFLYWGAGGPACPPLPLGGGTLLTILPPFSFLVSTPIPASGTAVIPAPIPPALPISIPIDVQWITLDLATGFVGASDGVHMTISLP